MYQLISKKMNQKRKGFTLIELVVVIAILGILAALAIPRFTDTRKNANAGVVLANLRTLESGGQLYMATYNKNTFTIADARSMVGEIPDNKPTGVTYGVTTATPAKAQATYGTTATLPETYEGLTIDTTNKTIVLQ